MFSISYDPAKQQITTVVDSLLTAEAARAFMDALNRQMIALMQQGQPFKILMDGGQAPVQSQAAYEQFRDIGRIIKRPAPTAIVVASALGKMQASRNIFDDVVRVFVSIDEARRWLAGVAPRQIEIHAEALV